MNVEACSRKSSTSSQKSLKDRSKNRLKHAQTNDEVIKEYELCLEQVLTWLLEAEHELSNMDFNKSIKNTDYNVTEQTDLEMVKKMFREHEQFMKSLTESQNSVGRVLHRGQQLCQKLEPNSENAIGILSQLHMVNKRWEHIRETATERQKNLHNQLNLIQRNHLQKISDWLTEIEKIIQTREVERLADELSACNQQIVEHTRIQEQIDNQQSNIQRLSSFIAIVNEQKEDSKNDGEEVEQLETLLQSVGKRWSDICEWAEQRARHLDGLSELLTHYNTSFEHLSEWLTQRQNELIQLQHVEKLETENDIIEQMRVLHKIESVLEMEHSSFVKLSQFCSELVQRFEQGKNLIMADKIRVKLDTITETWDNIVSQLEEHSQMLSKLSNIDKNNVTLTTVVINDILATSNINDKQFLSKKRSIDKVECGITSSDSETKKQQKKAEPEITDVNTMLSDTEQAIIVTEFIERVKLLERNIKSLTDWAAEFSISTRREDIRTMVQICQVKLTF